MPITILPLAAVTISGVRCDGNNAKDKAQRKHMPELQYS